MCAATQAAGAMCRLDARLQGSEPGARHPGQCLAVGFWFGGGRVSGRIISSFGELSSPAEQASRSYAPLRWGQSAGLHRTCGVAPRCDGRCSASHGRVRLNDCSRSFAPRSWRRCFTRARSFFRLSALVRVRDFEARTLMLKLANDYDKLADRAERDKAPTPSPIPKL